MTVTIDSFNPLTAQLFFTVTGAPSPPDPLIYSAINVQKSNDGGVTWIGSMGSTISPRTVSAFNNNTIFRLRIFPSGEYSNTIAANGQVTRTPIDGIDKLTFCNSPIYIREVADAVNLTTSIKIELYVWDGLLNKPLSDPNHILVKEKISPADSYISVPINDLIKPYIKPQFAYNRATPPAITSQGVFWQAQITHYTATGEQTRRTTPTYFATLGYKWNYQQGKVSDKNILVPYGASGFQEDVDKYYNPKIHNYFYQDFDFTQTLETSKSSNVIRYNEVTPQAKWKRCTQDPSLIIFINKLGLWETFTPHGKVTASTKVKRSVTNKSHRDPSRVDNTYVHSKVINAIDVDQSYVINTGSLKENMTSIIEEIIYSPLIYLIRFKGDLELVSTFGITIDNTYVTIDSTVITIDDVAIKDEYIGFFKTHQQIPVIVVDEDYTRKTRLNNKLEIDYNIKLDETNNKVNNIR